MLDCVEMLLFHLSTAIKCVTRKAGRAGGQFPGLSTGHTFSVKLTVHIFYRLFDRVKTGWVSDDFHVFSIVTVIVSIGVLTS